MPLIPAFMGEDPKSATGGMKIVLKLQFKSILFIIK